MDDAPEIDFEELCDYVSLSRSTKTTLLYSTSI